MHAFHVPACVGNLVWVHISRSSPVFTCCFGCQAEHIHSQLCSCWRLPAQADQ